jgi:CubicO group peptidase (beta-lactamase class C family)
VDKWITGFTYNAGAHVAHVMAMVAQSADLSLGHKTMQYDTIGTTQINSLSDILNSVIGQDTARLGSDLEQFTQRFVFGPLGMKQSQWSGGSATKIFAYSWSTTVMDMARVGLALLHGGSWSGRQLLDQGWVYRMTHPAFEDANTGYGYLTWLNASTNHNFGGIPISTAGWGGNQTVPRSPGTCAPVSVYPQHPHGLSDSPDCNYAAPYTCSQPYDVGVWNAVGLGGQNIQGHPGLDLVIVVKDLTPSDTGPTAPGILWDAVRPAIVAADPKYRGDDSAFCAAYSANAYAPDLH